MGGSNYSDAIYSSRIASARATGADVFAHTAAISSGRAARKVHEKLDPKRHNTLGKNIRESFDSAVHPESQAVAVLFDVTGSMHDVPRLLAEQKLGKLMATLVKKGILEHPHVLFGGIGDYTSDEAPLQVGQFEGGNEMDEALTNIWLEGGGGGSSQESYDLALYYMARHTDMDCFKKRGKKGYLFIIGDEGLYSKVGKQAVLDVIGDRIQEDIPVDQIVAEAKEKFEIFWLRPSQTMHYTNSTIINQVQKLFPERVIDLAKPEDVCEVIAAQIAMMEGNDLEDVAKTLHDIGTDASTVKRVTGALVKAGTTRSVSKRAVATGALVEAGKDAVSRL